MRQVIVAISLALVASGTAFADEFSGKASFGYLGTSGNAESLSVNAGVELDWTYDRWTHQFTAGALGSQDDVDTTAEAYTVGWQSNWAINDYSYLYGHLNGIKDKFAGYDRQITEAIGYGRNLIKNDTTLWTAEIGAGARQSVLRGGSSISETIVQAKTDYTYSFSETNEFFANASVESGDENTLINAGVGIKARLVGDLALVASYKIRSNSDVPAGSEKTDTFTAISLEYSF
ncbi:MAG: DUF481 domain-containing protein [Pseudomonadota bacterium]